MLVFWLCVVFADADISRPSVEDQSHTSMSAADELLDRPEATLALLNISEPATEPPPGPVFPTLEPYPWSEPHISPSDVPAGLTRVAIPHPDLRLVDFEAQRESQLTNSFRNDAPSSPGTETRSTTEGFRSRHEPLALLISDNGNFISWAAERNLPLPL